MRKNSIIAVILLISALTLAGCSKVEDKQVDDSGTIKRELNGRPDFGQPETPADIMGIVKSIIGNEVTILKIDRASRSNRGMNGEGDGSEAGEGEEPRTPAMGTGFTGGGRMPGMGGGARRDNSDEDAQAQMLERMKEMSTGEVKIIIPVGIQMLKPDLASEPQKPEVVEANLVDVKQDKMMQIWLNKDITDRQVADFVFIMR